MIKRIIAIVIILIVLIFIFMFFFSKSKKEEGANKNILGDVPVNITVIKKENLSNIVSLVGVINPNNDVMVVSETQGVCFKDYLFVGKTVNKGEVLADIDDILKKSNYAKAEINYQISKREFERNQLLYEENSISAAALDISRLNMKSAEFELAIAKKQLDDTKIKAPITGVVNSDLIEVGMLVKDGTEIANIVDISTLKVKVNISEKDAFQLKTGDEVEITTDVYPGVTYKGKVYSIGSKSDEAHTYAVEIRLPNNSQNPLKGGMFARVNFTSVKSLNALAIPREALVGSVKEAQVYVIKDNLANLKRVVIGRESGQFLEVLNGLSEGDVVVTSGQNNLSANTKVVVIK